MAKVAAAPEQAFMEGAKATIGIHIEETVFVDFGGSNGKKHKMEYYRAMGFCKCPYAVTLDGRHVAKFHAPGCLDNGLMFCICPLLTCGGNLKLMGMDGADGVEKFVFVKSLFPCWPVVEAFVAMCSPCGACMVSMDGCCHYCKGTEFRSLTQPVFKGPWGRLMGTEPEKVGEFITTQRFSPVSCCFAAPTPLKYYFKPTTEAGKKLAEDELVALSLVLQLYRGMPVPCKMCSPVGFQMPTGVPCLDMGLSTETNWKSVQEVMKDSE